MTDNLTGIKMATKLSAFDTVASVDSYSPNVQEFGTVNVRGVFTFNDEDGNTYMRRPLLARRHGTLDTAKRIVEKMRENNKGMDLQGFYTVTL